MTLASTTRHRSSALLDHLARLTRLRAESALAPLGLRPRHLVALTVLRDHGSPTQQALAAALRTDRTNLIGLLNELETDGLILRRRSSEDRRRHIVELTDDAKPVLDAFLPEITALHAAEFEIFTPDEREQLITLLARLATHITTLDVDTIAGAAQPRRSSRRRKSREPLDHDEN